MTVHTHTPAATRLDGVVIGILLDVPEASSPVVAFPGCPSETGIAATTTTVSAARTTACSRCGASIPRFTDTATVAGGMFRAWVYSTIVAAVSCYQGYHASGGARGVGQAHAASSIPPCFAK